MYNEEQNRKVLEFLAKINENKTPKKMNKEDLIREITDNGLDMIRRIDFNNNNITDNIAFINSSNGVHKLIITNEFGTIITDEDFEELEEAYASLVERLKDLKTFEELSEKKTL